MSNTLNQWSFYQIFRSQALPHQRKTPLLKTFWRRFCSQYLQREGIGFNASAYSESKCLRIFWDSSGKILAQRNFLFVCFGLFCPSFK